MDFDVVVIGAGHAGIEAALAASRLGAKVGVITLRLAGIGQMSCNPAIGGVAKGHLVREIDALGGAMAQVADATAIQARRLNASRGPAVRSTRVQNDSALYKARMAQVLTSAPGVTVLEDEAVGLCSTWNIGTSAAEKCSTWNITLSKHGTVAARAVIVTTGTFLNGLCHIGSEQFGGGRVGDQPAGKLSAALRGLGIKLQRFKTGTTPRLHKDSINWDKLPPQHGDTPRPYLSFEPPAGFLPQLPCYMTHTTEATHRLVRDNLHLSALYGGIIEGIGPRYCPSLEDKIVRFKDKGSHQIFLEPEGLTSERIYPNGLSTSLPRDIQEAFIRTLPGCEAAEIIQHGYAVEYDYAPPTQLLPSLMVKNHPGLFIAGQMNGTSGYEEAAAQGLMAGINAVRMFHVEHPAVLRRDQGYIGVLVDDLVNKGVSEPYRMFTSRAEYRLRLREANAEARLAEVGRSWGVVDAGRWRRAQAREQQRADLRGWLSRNSVVLHGEKRLAVDWLKRTDISAVQVLGECSTWNIETVSAVVEEIRYAGYIAREQRDIERVAELEDIPLPAAGGAFYARLAGLSREVQEVLAAMQPLTLGQASRIPGVTPAAVAVLRVALRR